MKKLTIFWMIIISCYFASGQDTILRYYWSIEAGASLLVPVREYNEVTNWDFPHTSFHSEYKVQPCFNASNFFLNIGFFRNILSKKKNHFGFNVKIGYLHHETKAIKQGFTTTDEDYFEGIETEILKNEIGFIEIGFMYRYQMCKKIFFVNQLSGRSFWLFHRIDKGHRIDTRAGHSASPWWRSSDWQLDLGIILIYSTGLQQRINKRWSITEQVDIPLYITRKYSREDIIGLGRDPAMLTPYLTSINYLNLINLQLSLSFIL